jgi:hypothetical protein
MAKFTGSDIFARVERRIEWLFYEGEEDGLCLIGQFGGECSVMFTCRAHLVRREGGGSRYRCEVFARGGEEPFLTYNVAGIEGEERVKHDFCRVVSDFAEIIWREVFKEQVHIERSEL